MDRYKVSGSDLRDFYNDETTLQDVFRDIESDLQVQNRVVCRFILNGLELSESDEVKFSNIRLSDVETLEYLAENKNRLVFEVVDAWLSALPEMMTASEFLCQRMRFQGPNGLLKDIHDYAENLEFLVDSLTVLKGMVSKEEIKSVPKWQISEEQSKKTITEALSAIEKKDFVLLADILEYDLNNVLQNWVDCLKDLSSILRGMGSDNAARGNGSEVGADSGVRRRVAH